MKGSYKMLRKVLIAGGGTGGHIFPAIAIANALQQRNPDIELLFLGALGRMEMEKVPAAGFSIVGLPIVGFPRRKTPLALLRFFIHWYKSNRIARKIVRDFQPQVVVGVGGYASVPAMQAAQKLRIPTLIQEQNSYAGKANRILAKRAVKIAVAYPDMERYFPQQKIVLTGNPVRAELLRELPTREEACRLLQLPLHTKNILVMGGSLGARKLSEAILNHAEEIVQRQDITILLQTGNADFDAMRERLGSRASNILLLPFIAQMDCAYAASDLIVSRAGAIAISELCIVAKPLILVPSPYVAEDHQTKNARCLANQYAAVLVPESELAERLWVEMNNLLEDDTRTDTMIRALRAMARPDATEQIASLVEQVGM